MLDLSFFNRSLALVLSTVLAIQPALMEVAQAQEIIIDPNGNVGTRLQSGRTASVVDIATPNAGGVSHNRYKRLNTPQGGGAVLNNSAQESTTAVAGKIAGNSNLASGSATTIVNEVTSTESSSLKGRIEVAGDRANVIVANPNGLGCDGCTFLNTNEATLTTGVPVINGGTVRLDVTKGAVTIGRSGFDGAATGVSEVNLIGRTVVVDGKVTAINGINVQGGAQRYDLNNRKTAGALTSAVSAGSDYAIDGTAFGAMEAGRIQVVGNEQGLGVRLRGAAQASMGDVDISGLARVEVSSASAQRHVTVSSSDGPVEIDRDLSATTGTVSVTARGSLSFSARSGVYGETGVVLRSNEGELAVFGDLQSGAGVLLNGRRLNFGAYAVADDAITFAVIDEAVVNGASIVASKIDGLAFGKSINIANSAFFSAENVALRTGQLTFGKDVLIDGRSDTETSGLVASVTGDFRNSSDLRNIDLSKVTWGGNLLNEVGGILSGKALAITTGGVVRNSGTIYGDDSVALNVAGLFNNETGSIFGGAVTLTTSGELVNRGTIRSEGDLRLQAGADLTNAGFVQAARSWWSAKNITNLGTGDLRIAEGLQIAATGALLSQGGLNAVGAIKLTGAQLDNVGLTISGNSITLIADRISNTGTLTAPISIFLQGNSITNAGTIASYDNAELRALTSVRNTGSLIADNTLVVSAPAFLNEGDKALVRAKTGKIGSGSIANSGKIFLVDSFVTTLDLFENNGSFTSAGNILLTGRDSKSKIVLGADSQTVAGLQPDDKTQALEVGAGLSLKANDIQIVGEGTGDSKRTATVAAGGNVVVLDLGVLEIGGNIRTKAGNITLTGADIRVTSQGSVYAGGDTALNSKGGLSNAGSVVTKGKLDLSADFGRLDNSGVLSMGRTGTFALSGALTNAGLLSTEGAMAVKAPSISNNGYLQSGGSMALTALGDTKLKGATIAADGMAIQTTYLLLGKGLVTVDTKNKSGENTGFISAKALQIKADSFYSQGTISLTGATDTSNWAINDTYRQTGLAQTVGHLNVTAGSVVSERGSLVLSSRNFNVRTTGTRADLDLAGSLTGLHLTISSATGLSVQESSIVSSSGNVTLNAVGKVSLLGQASAKEWLTVKGRAVSVSGKGYAKQVKVESETWLAINSDAAITAKESLAISSLLGLTNAGLVSSGQSATVSGGTYLTNKSGAKIEATTLSLLTDRNDPDNRATITNEGEIFGAEKLKTYSDAFNNANRVRAGTADIKTTSYIRNSGRILGFAFYGRAGGNFTNEGSISVDEIITIVAQDGLTNLDGASLYARIIGLASKERLKNEGRIGSSADTEKVDLSAEAEVSNVGFVRGKNIKFLAGNVTNGEKGLVEANQQLFLDTQVGGIVNRGVLKGFDTFLLAKTNVENQNAIDGTSVLKVVGTRVFNGGILKGADITLGATEGGVTSENAISAGTSLGLVGDWIDVKNVSARDEIKLHAQTGGITLGGTAISKTVSIQADDTLAAGSSAIRGTDQIFIKAGDIRRTDIAATNRKLGIVSGNTEDLYIELKNGSFGWDGDVTQDSATGVAVDKYEQANLDVRGRVKLLASKNVFLTGNLKSGLSMTIKGSQFTALRNLDLAAANNLHVEGSRFLKNYGNVKLNADRVTLKQNWGFFYTSDWLKDNVNFDLVAVAKNIIIDSDHRFVGKSVTLSANNYIRQIDSVISARKIDYIAGNDILIEFDAFDWRSGRFTDFSSSYDANASEKIFGLKKDDKPSLDRQSVLNRNKEALSKADTSDWWDTVSAGIGGRALSAQSGGITLSAGADLTLHSGKMHSSGDITLTAKGTILSEPIYIENDQDERPVSVGWSFDGDRYEGVDGNHDRSLVKINELRAYENQISADGDISISGKAVVLIGTRVASADGNITVQAGDGGITMLAAPGFWSYDYTKTTTKKKLFAFYKSRKTISVDRYRDIYKPTTLIANNGTVNINVTGTVKKKPGDPAEFKDGNAIVSAGTSITAKNIVVKTQKPGQNITLGTYVETDVDETRTKTSRSIFWVVPFGGSDEMRKRRIVTNTGNSMLADEILDLKSSGDLTLIGGAYQAKKVRVSADGKLNIIAAINSASETAYSRVDNMVTVTTVNEGSIVETAELPKIRSTVKPVSFEVGGKVTIKGDEGPSLNSRVINSVSTRKFDESILGLYTPKDAVAAKDQAEEVGNTYVYKPPTTGDYAYIKTLFDKNGATYEPITLRNQTWYDKQVQLNPAFQALLSIAIASATGGLGITAWQKAALDSLLNSAAGGAITGTFDADKAFRNAITAGVSTYVSGELIKGFGLEPPKPEGDLTLRGLQNRFTPELIAKRGGAMLISHGVGNVANGRPVFEGIDKAGRDWLVGEGMGIVQNAIGGMGAGRGEKWEGSIPHISLHGGLGCIASKAMGGTCASGFFAGASQSVLSGSRLSDEEKASLMSFAGALSGYFGSGGSAAGVTSGSGIAMSGFVNNYLTHKDLDDLKAAIRECKSKSPDGQCTGDARQRIISDYKSRSRQNDFLLLQTCQVDTACIRSGLNSAATDLGSWTTVKDLDYGIALELRSSAEPSQYVENAYSQALAIQAEKGRFCSAQGLSGAGCEKAWQDHSKVVIAAAGIVLDFVPFVGDIKGAVECVEIKTAAACGGAVLSVASGPGGDVVKLIFKRGDTTLEATIKVSDGSISDIKGPYSRIVPGGGLQAHEAAGGHLIERHVGKTDADQIARLRSENISAASSFPDRATAERVVSDALDANSRSVEQFLNGPKRRLTIDYDAGRPVGSVMTRSSNASVPSSKVQIVIERSPSMPMGYRIVTGYPVL